MSPPPYHLRKNKAADRFAFIEAIRRIPKLGLDLNNYTYCGFGGPYLEDMRLIYEFCPEIKMISIEMDRDVCKRQKFHRPCGNLEIVNSDMNSFIATYDSNNNESIFWLDYTGLNHSNFQEFAALLGKVVKGSIIKITLRAETRDYYRWDNSEKPDMIAKFRSNFAKYISDAKSSPPWEKESFALFIKKMLQKVVQDTLPKGVYESTFIPISSFYYSDGATMFTLTGIIWPRDDIDKIENAFGDWDFSSFSWSDKPKRIDIPDLSVKERLNLQEFLPCGDGGGHFLLEKLGYLIEDDMDSTEDALAQYAAFHRYYPYFLRGTP